MKLIFNRYFSSFNYMEKHFLAGGSHTMGSVFR